MAEAREFARAWCILRWIFTGVILGLAVSSVICYLQPKMYESSALLLADEEDGRTVALSPARAAQALRMSSDAYDWAEYQDFPIKTVCENTLISAQDGMVEIRVRSSKKLLARDLALELSWLFRGMDEEERVASMKAELWPLSEEEEEVMFDRETVERLMNEECREAGCNTVFRAIPTLILRGSKEAKDLWGVESFRLHWDFYEKATWQIAGEPKSDVPPLPLARFPTITDMPVSPNVTLYLFTGFFVGSAIGILVGYRRSLRILEAPPSKKAAMEPLPAYAETDPPPLPDTLDRNKRLASPEEEW